MIYTNRQRFKKNIRSVRVVLVIILAFYGFLIYSFNKYVERGTKLHEKTTFTDQEKKNLWSELGLEYIDLDISKAYYRSSQNRVEKLFVISEGFDSIDAELEYLKQFKGNENVCQGQENHKIYNISYNTFIDHSNLLIECTTYKENGKYYLKFIKNEAEHSGNNTILYEMFGIDDSGKE